MAAGREPLRYRFGPLERRGVIAGLRGNQVAALGAGALAAAMLVRGGTVPGVGLALAAATAAVVAAFAPVGGRIVLDWAPVAAAFGARRGTGGHRFRSAAAGRGTTFRAGRPAAADLPKELAGVELLAVPYDGVQEVGVLAEGGRYAAVLSARGRSFALKDWSEQEQQLAAWAGVVAELGREGSPVVRLQWTERTVPDDGREHQRYLTTTRDPALDPGSPVLRSYQALVDAAGPVTQAHRLHLAVQVDPGRARRAVRQAGGGAAGACAVLLREAETLARRLRDAGIEVDGILAPRLLAQELRLALDPAARQQLAWAAVRDGTQGGVDPRAAWATAAEETWRSYRTDSAVHRTYWIEEWPRTEAGASRRTSSCARRSWPTATPTCASPATSPSARPTRSGWRRPAERSSTMPARPTWCSSRATASRPGPSPTPCRCAGGCGRERRLQETGPPGDHPPPPGRLPGHGRGRPGG